MYKKGACANGQLYLKISDGLIDQANDALINSRHLRMTILYKSTTCDAC